jgi:hypothetical protein
LCKIPNLQNLLQLPLQLRVGAWSGDDFSNGLPLADDMHLARSDVRIVAHTFASGRRHKEDTQQQKKNLPETVGAPAAGYPSTVL